MCAYESEMLLFQLHLYARKRQPGLKFEPERIRYILDKWGITNMRQLFDLPSEAKIALVIPLMIPKDRQRDDRTTLMDSGSRVAAAA